MEITWPVLFFILLVSLTVLQRLIELRIANKNTRVLLSRGAKEFGANHYKIIVLLHTSFFASLIIEFFLHSKGSIHVNYVFVALFILAQFGRFWVLSSLKDRWTTRIIVLQGEQLVRSGPYRFIDHPNYAIVALELLSLPLAFGLYMTTILFSIANALLLTFIRIPQEEEALRWAHSQ